MQLMSKVLGELNRVAGHQLKEWGLRPVVIRDYDATRKYDGSEELAIQFYNDAGRAHSITLVVKNPERGWHGSYAMLEKYVAEPIDGTRYIHIYLDDHDSIDLNTTSSTSAVENVATLLAAYELNHVQDFAKGLIEDLTLVQMLKASVATYPDADHIVSQSVDDEKIVSVYATDGGCVSTWISRRLHAGAEPRFEWDDFVVGTRQVYDTEQVFLLDHPDASNTHKAFQSHLRR